MHKVEIPKEFNELLVKDILATTALEPHKNSEIEIRLKSFSNKKGVTQSFFAQTLTFLKTFSEWEQIKEVESSDYYYEDNFRTTHIVEEGGDVTRSTIQKKRVASKDITVHGSASVSTVRISHTIEETANPKQIVELRLVRVKRRTSFIYKGWSYDLTKVWEGRNASSVKRRRRTSPPDTYEVEVEKLDNSLFYSTDYLVVSLLLKAISLLRPAEVYLS